MPFGEDLVSLERELSPPLVQSDLIETVEMETRYSYRGPAMSPVGQDAGAGAGLTVVTLNGEAELNGEGPAAVPEADMGPQAEEIAPSSAPRKHGRPSLSASATPAKSVASRTPRSTKSAAAVKSAGRSTGKRKAAELETADEAEVTPAPKKRGRPARAASAATSARLAAKAAKKGTRGRPKSSTPAKRKAGRAKKDLTNGEVPQGEYEVEEIVDSAIDAETMEHLYFVKWKGYPASDNTWEPKKNLTHAHDLVRDFDAKKKKADAEKAPKNASSGENNRTTRARKPKAVKEVKKAPKQRGRKRRTQA
ncbi:hypothetical protein VTK56DRAFT_868 [Thermocarpiscus australiensis]